MDRIEWEPGMLVVMEGDGGCSGKIHVVDLVGKWALGDTALYFKPCECSRSRSQPAKYANNCRPPIEREAMEWWNTRHGPDGECVVGIVHDENHHLCRACDETICLRCMCIYAEGETCRCGKDNPVSCTLEVGQKFIPKRPIKNDSYSPEFACWGKPHTVRVIIEESVWADLCTCNKDYFPLPKGWRFDKSWCHPVSRQVAKSQVAKKRLPKPPGESWKEQLARCGETRSGRDLSMIHGIHPLSPHLAHIREHGWRYDFRRGMWIRTTWDGESQEKTDEEMLIDLEPRPNPPGNLLPVLEGREFVAGAPMGDRDTPLPVPNIIRAILSAPGVKDRLVRHGYRCPLSLLVEGRKLDIAVSYDPPRSWHPDEAIGERCLDQGVVKALLKVGIIIQRKEKMT